MEQTSVRKVDESLLTDVLGYLRSNSQCPKFLHLLSHYDRSELLHQIENDAILETDRSPRTENRRVKPINIRCRCKKFLGNAEVYLFSRFYVEDIYSLDTERVLLCETCMKKLIMLENL